MKHIFLMIAALFIAANVSAGGLSEFSTFYSGLGVEAGIKNTVTINSRAGQKAVFLFFIFPPKELHRIKTAEFYTKNSHFLFSFYFF